MKQKRRGSIRIHIIMPVIILGIAAILSNIAAISNIRKVNENAARIADNDMASLTELSVIKEQIHEIHNLGLSHVTAVDSAGMIQKIDSIKEKEAELFENIEKYEQFIETADRQSYKQMQKYYETFLAAVRRICAFSANRQQAQANMLNKLCRILILRQIH